MDQQKINAYGDELYAAWLARRPLEPLRLREPGITIEDAYKIQERFVARRVAAGDWDWFRQRAGQFREAWRSCAGPVDR